MRAAGDPADPVLLLSHGFSLDMSEWCDLWPDLARGFRVVAFDHRSHGTSAPARTAICRCGRWAVTSLPCSMRWPPSVPRW